MLQRFELCGLAIVLMACGSRSARGLTGEPACDAGCAPNVSPDRDGAQQESHPPPAVVLPPDGRPGDAGAVDASAVDASGEDARAADAMSADAGPVVDEEPSCAEYAEQQRPLTRCSIPEPPVGCTGAVSIESGRDLNGDGALDDSEVESASVDCIGPSNCDTTVDEPGPLVACQLPGADLHDRRLNNFIVSADLSGANLAGVRCGLSTVEYMWANRCHFECSDLSGADLSGGNLVVPLFGGADLSGAVLRGTRMVSANLGGAIFADADLAGADLSAAHLAGGDLRGANLSGANLSYAETFGIVGCPAVLPDANWLCAGIVRKACGDCAQAFMLLGPLIKLAERDLTGQDLSGADLRLADLQNASLTGADLLGAELPDARLVGAHTAELVSCPATLPNEFWLCVAQPALARFALVGPGAILSYTDFSGANLSGANLYGAQLVATRLLDADLTGADLRGADLSSASGEPASVVDTLTDSSTVCYDGQPGPCW